MFYARHFKNFDAVEFDDERPVSLLVGPNGAGKSNLIEAVEMLAFLAVGRPLHEITDVGREGGLEVRGGLDACATRGEEAFTLGRKWQISVAGQMVTAEYEISVAVSGQPRICGERLAIDENGLPIFEILPGEIDATSADNHVRYDNHARGGKKPVVRAAADRSALAQYARFAVGNRDLPATMKIIQAVIDDLASPMVYDPAPQLMRNYERESENYLARNGFNISPVLSGMREEVMFKRIRTTKGILRERFVAPHPGLQRILERISQLPDEPFTDFDFVETREGDVMLGFKTPEYDKPVTARVLSDGTLRALAILVALETAPRRRQIILEEFDNGVHPSRTHILAEALFECAERNKLRVLATTHNPATLNALSPEQVDSVLFVIRDHRSGFARLVSLADLPAAIDLIEQGRLGDLVTRRVYEQYLAPDYEKRRQAAMMEFAESLP